MGDHYQALVEKGRVGMWLDGAHLCLEVDPEGSAACVLTRQDAEEVAQVMTGLWRELYQASPKRTEPFAPTVETLSPTSYQWALPSARLTIAIEEMRMTIRAEPPGAILLSVDRAVEVIQIIERLLNSGR